MHEALGYTREPTTFHARLRGHPHAKPDSVAAPVLKSKCNQPGCEVYFAQVKHAGRHSVKPLIIVSAY